MMSYGLISYVVPHSLYPTGYHCKPQEPLQFIAIASQKNHVSLYHLGIYADVELTSWINKEYSNFCNTKLDMGKGCVRFKKSEEIPSEFVARLVSKLSVDEWIDVYEAKIKPR